MKKARDEYDSLSPIDYRYWDEDVAQYLSENAYTRYKLAVELALVKALAKRKVCSAAVVREVEKACAKVTTAEVYEEEGRIKHDIRALVNCIRAKVSDKAKPYVHMTATSQDIIDTANAARWKDAILKVLVPSLVELITTLVKIVERESETVQVGRTHGQHAVPITFGFTISAYVSRLGQSIEALSALAKELRGKFAGAVGAYNASSLFFDNPESFEADVLKEMGLLPSEQSSQVTPAEPMVRLLCEITIAAGIMANLADDMRHLQRTEIAEIGEEFEDAQVGSSTMPQKRNPINFENAKSLWKTIVPRIVTAFMDQISEHQRDLTNSASTRTYGETLAYAVSAAKRLSRTMKKISVDKKNVERNLNMQMGLVAAEPLYIMLAAMGHPDAHEKVRNLTLKAQSTRAALEQVAMADSELQPYLKRMSAHQRKILSTPSLYTGIAAKKSLAVAKRWKKKF